MKAGIETRGCANGKARYLALDSGKTGCRAALFVGGIRIASVQVTGLGTLADRGVHARLEELLKRVKEKLGPELEVEAVGAGMAGLFESWEAVPGISSTIRRTFGAEKVVLTSDVVSAYCGALGCEPGVVVAAGTGTVALAVGDEGKFARADGWGYLLGDEGSGFAVGQAGLRGALRAKDGRGGSEVLRELAERRYGPLERLAGSIHDDENPARRVAAFAPDVAAAARMGDAEAAAIWQGAARDVARTTAAAARHVFEPGEAVKVSWSGGLFAEEELLLKPFGREIRELLPGACLAAPLGDALAGAGRLAAGPVRSVLEPLLYRAVVDPERKNAMQTAMQTSRR